MKRTMSVVFRARGSRLPAKGATALLGRAANTVLAFVITLGSIIPPVWASEADALLISRNIRGLNGHLPHGTVIDPMFKSADPTSPDYAVIDRYTRGGDSALWTGHYLAAEAFRYRVTGSAEALKNVRDAIDGIRSLVDVTGTNLLARCLVPVDWENDFNHQAIITEEARHGIYVNYIERQQYYQQYYWVGNTSRDQYSGVFFGLGVAYDMVNDSNGQDVRLSVSEIVTRLLNFLLKNNWSVVMPNGTISTTFLGRYEQQLSFLQVGRRVNPGSFDSPYKSHRTRYASSVGTAVWYDSLDNHKSYFKFNLDYINLYNLIRLEEVTSSYRKNYLSAYNILRNTTQSHGNPHFNLIDREVRGANSTRDAETITLLDEWLPRPRRDTWVDLRCCRTACGPDKACSPIPVKDRVRTDFLWQRSPFLLYGGGYGTIETAGIDYILPYWMARYYGILLA